MKLQPDIETYLNQLFPQFEPPLVALLKEQCFIKAFESGEFILQTGQYFRSTMLIVEGRIKLYRENDGEGEFFMYDLEPGDACALSMISATKQEKSKIMAQATEDTTILLMPVALMDELMTKYKSWYYFVIGTYRKRFEELLEVIDSIAFKSMDERLYAYLKKQAQTFSPTEIKLTHQRIADDLNSSREVVSRLLKKMEQQGKVKLFRSHIEWVE